MPFAGRNHFLGHFNFFFWHNWKNKSEFVKKDKNTQRGVGIPAFRCSSQMLTDTQKLFVSWGKYLTKARLLPDCGRSLQNLGIYLDERQNIMHLMTPCLFDHFTLQFSLEKNLL